MKAFDRFFAALCAVIAAIFAVVNILMFSSDNSSGGRQYRVDAARIAAELETRAPDEIDLFAYQTITGVFPVEDEDSLLGENSDYLIKRVNGRLYRIDYRADKSSNTPVLVNSALGLISLAVIAAMLVIRTRVLKPFHALREVPYELSKGNLTVPISENKHRLFGRFTWGMNMLRDNLEQQKQRELDLQAEKKKLIISLSHDIKLPLSAIKLYAKALEKSMYDDARRNAAAVKIDAKADEIESYVSQIVRASSEDFLALTVNCCEFYIYELTKQIESYYSDKLSLLGTEFMVEKHGNCLLCGDLDRAVEVLQNIIENAIKYGDGKRISLSFSDEEDCRLITVTNSGSELPVDELPHIFESFFRGSNAGDKAGSGLGLYICRTLMRKMGGDIFASCKNGEMSVTVVFRRA